MDVRSILVDLSKLRDLVPELPGEEHASLASYRLMSALTDTHADLRFTPPGPFRALSAAEACRFGPTFARSSDAAPPNECKDIRMARKSSREPQPFEIAMNDLAGERELWNLQKHLDGCLSAINTILPMLLRSISRWRRCGESRTTWGSAPRAASSIEISWMQIG
jgi:hypothetical protein